MSLLMGSGPVTVEGAITRKADEQCRGTKLVNSVPPWRLFSSCLQVSPPAMVNLIEEVPAVPNSVSIFSKKTKRDGGVLALSC